MPQNKIFIILISTGQMTNLIKMLLDNLLLLCEWMYIDIIIIKISNKSLFIIFIPIIRKFR